MFRENSGRYLIKTPTGHENFKGVQKKIVDSLYTIIFDDDTFIKCSGNHAFLTNDGFTKTKDLKLQNTLSGKSIKKINCQFGEFEVYDPVGVENHSTYFSNGVVSHNTEFIGSSATLITGTKLKMLAFHDPIKCVDNFYMYEEPQKGRSYVLCADCAEGVNQDYSAFSIMDVTEIPYRQVGVFRDNKLPLLMYPSVIYHYAKIYNEAFVLIETNNIGQQVVDNLHYDLEYENILKLEYHNIKGQNISSGFKRSFSLGMKTTKSVKKIGCANLKTLVETDKLIINDFNTIAELNTFARVRDSYEAEEGNHDDLVMTLVFFAWLTTQSFFKENTDTDIRRRLVQETNEKFYEEEMTPFGIFDDGQQEEKFVSDGDVWTVSDMKGYTPTSF